MATVSRLILNHPALGTTGGASLHTAIEALYQKIGDAIANRWYQLTDFDNGESVDCEHNFDTDIANLRWQIYVYTGGQWVLTTDQSSPARSTFTVAETVGFEDTKLTITNVSAGNDLLVAFVITNDPISLENGDIQDIDITTTAPEDGQALVYDSASDKFKPGASGDSSFKIQSVSDPNATIKGGYLINDSGIELATYDGVNYGADFTANLDTIFGGNPVDATTYYLYADLWSLGSEVTLANGRKIYGVTQANLYLSTTKPSSLNPRRYIPLGFIRSATTGTVWSGAGAAFGTLATRRHDSVAAFISEPQVKSDVSITTAAASNVINHGLAGEPQVVNLFYYDGTKKIGLDVSAHLTGKTATQLTISSLALTFGGGQYVEVQAVYYPGFAGSVTSLQHDFQSGWYENTATTTVAHGLQSGSIRGYEVQEWNTTTGRIRNIDRSALVINYDDTNFYLDWTGLSPSATLKYRVVAGGTPIPASVPIEFGGYNKFVGFGPGSYTTLAAAVAAAAQGDAILVNQSHSLTADLNINVADLKVTFMPGVVVTVAGALTNGIRLTAARIQIENGYFKFEPTGAQARGLSVEAADCDLDKCYVELNTAQTLTDALHITVAGSRTYAKVRLKATLGTITNGVTNNDGASHVDVWG